MPAIRLTSTGWLPLSALSGAPVGTAMYIQNQGAGPLLSQESATQPAASDNSGVATQPGQSLTVTSGTAQLWLRSSPGGLSAFAGGIPSGTTITAPLTATTAQLYTTTLASANNGKYAVVDGAQLALSNGTNWISVANGSVLDPVRAVAATGVTLNTATFSGVAGGTVQLTATVAPGSAPTGVTWFTSDPTVATVSQTGLVSFVGAGTVYISVRTADGLNQAYAVGTLTANAATGVTVSPAAPTVTAGNTQQLTAAVAPAGAAQAVTWSSSNPTLAQVSRTGLVSMAAGAVGGATVVISATAANGVRGSTTLTAQSATQMPLRVATAYNLVASQVITPNAAKAMRVVSRDVHLVRGGDQETLVVAIPMWGIHDFITDGARFATRNNLSFVGVSVEYNGVVAPIPLAGSRSFTALGGETKLLTEVSARTLFGIPSIPNGSQLRVNVMFDVPANLEYHKTQPRGNYDGVSKYYTYDPTATTMDVDAAGAAAWTGTAPAVANDGLSPIILGRKVAGTQDRSFVEDGDSRTAGYNESGTVKTLNGPGYSARTCAKYDMPRLSTAVGGTRVFVNHNDPVINQLYAYGRFAYVDKATNNLSDGSLTTAATLYSRQQDLVAAMRSKGVEKVIIGQVFPRTASTDGWTTKANQTPNWDVLANAVAYNSGLATLAGFDAVATHTALRDATDGNYWMTASGVETGDGIHYNDKGAADGSTSLTPLWASTYGLTQVA